MKGSRFSGGYFLLILGVVVSLVLIYLGGNEEKNNEGESISVVMSEREEEKRVTYLLEGMEGVSGVQVMLMRDDTGKVDGAVVICRGGEDVEVQEKIVSALRALYGIGAHRISVSG